MAAESPGKIGDARTTDSILPFIHDPAALVREASVLAMGRLKPAATNGSGGSVDTGAAGSC